MVPVGSGRFAAYDTWREPARLTVVLAKFVVQPDEKFRIHLQPLLQRILLLNDLPGVIFRRIFAPMHFLLMHQPLPLAHELFLALILELKQVRLRMMPYLLGSTIFVVAQYADIYSPSVVHIFVHFGPGYTLQSNDRV